MTVKIGNPQNDQTQAQTQFRQVTLGGISNPLGFLYNGGEVYEKLFSIIEEKIENLNKSNDKSFFVHKLINRNYGLNYSGIIISKHRENDNIATSHILMVEQTGQYPDKIVENFLGNRYEIVRTPADALDEKYVLSAQQLVADRLKLKPSDVIVVDGTLVPNEFVVDESNVYYLLNNAISSIHSEYSIKVDGYKGINISNSTNNRNANSFFIDISFNPENDLYDQTCMPIKRDICLSLSLKNNSNSFNNRSINQSYEIYDIVKVYGYIDFEWFPVIINGATSTQKFVPNFIITHIDTSSNPYIVITPDILMLSVAVVLALNEDMIWAQSFRFNYKKGENDLRDIGGLNIEGNIENTPGGFGKKLDTKTKTYTALELIRFLQMVSRPNIVVSIDLPKAGPSTWYTSLLSYIKFRNNRNAYNRLIEFLQTLTNGNFSNTNIPIFTDITNKIHGGYYKTKDGIRDIRHLSNYLAVANFISNTNQNPDNIKRYTNTLYSIAYPQEIRLSERKKFIDEMSGGTAVIKMYYDRVTFNASFLAALASSLKLAGFTPVLNNVGLDNNMFTQRYSIDFSNALLGTDIRIDSNNIFQPGIYSPYSYNRTF